MRILVFVAIAACSPTYVTHGVPNFAQVDVNVYRSGQITSAEGWAYVAAVARGRRVHVVKLNFTAEGADDLAVSDGFDVHELAIQPDGDRDAWDDVVDAFRSPDPGTLTRAEQVLEGAAARTSTDIYLVHCTHGEDRTGLVIGLHRVLHDHWTAHAAWTEMIAHHYHPELAGLAWAWFDATRKLR